MFIESKEVDQGSLTNSDICIIGAGAAGISMAHEFVGTSYEVTVLESGGLTPDQKTQSLNTGTNYQEPKSSYVCSTTSCTQ
jgi:choline dehydrogenase-like flavoprotein